jgi:hypothetical protein
MKCFKIKFKWYHAFEYKKRVTHIFAANANEAIDELHSIYSTNPYRPCFILKIKEINI